MRTYGDKPLSFQLEENGEYYYVGSEVYTTPNPIYGFCSRKKKHFFVLSFRLGIIYGYSVDLCTKSTREWQEER